MSVRKWTDAADRQKAQKEFEREFESIARMLIWKFGSDEACKDCSRFFYGTNQKDRVIVLSGSLTDEVIARLRKEYDATHPKLEKEELKAAVTFYCDSADENERRRLYGERALEIAKQRIESAPMGEKHKTRSRICYMIGGYVAGGLLDESLALAELEISVRSNSDNLSKAWKTADECFAAGKSEPITFEMCERRREYYTKRNKKTEPIVTDDGEIIETTDDPPISNNPAIETYLRKVLANASRFTRARLMMVAALGFTKLPWRLLNAILSYERNKLGVKVITNDMMLHLYAKNGDVARTERTLKRDKKKLWEAQRKVGVELVWYSPGYETQDGRRFGSRYKSNLDRWVLEAIARAIEEKGGKYYIKDYELIKACEAIAKDIPRCPAGDDRLEKEDQDGETIQKSAEESLERVAEKFHEAWDTLELTIGERHIRTKYVLKIFGSLLLSKADLALKSGKRRRKKYKAEVDKLVDEMVERILEEVSPVSKYARVSNAAPSPKTVYGKGVKNDTPGSDLHGCQNVTHAGNEAPDEESTTYEKSPEIRPGPAIWRNADFDQYVEVVGSAGIGADCREYVWIRGSTTAIPAGEIYYADGDMWLENFEESGSGPEQSPEELAEMMDEVTASVMNS